jgi:hypothetical protein
MTVDLDPTRSNPVWIGVHVSEHPFRLMILARALAPGTTLAVLCLS